MNRFEKTYIDIILEADFSDSFWQKNDSYKGIDFYIRKDQHLKRRL